MVRETRVFVIVFVEVAVTALGVTVLVSFAVPEGTVTVENGPVVTTSVEVVVMVCVWVGVVKILTVIVGVTVLMT